MRQVQNTGYMIDNLCYPGDAFQYPDADVDILALPVSGPWMRLKDAIDYAKNINPRIVFSVHDAFIHDWASFIWFLLIFAITVTFGIGITLVIFRR